MKLFAYSLEANHEHAPKPAARERGWIDATQGQFAKRCLPMLIANAYGWVIGSPASFTAIWDGGDASEAIRMRRDDSGPAPAHAAFGHGVLTFDIPFLFRTEPGYDLFVSGPFNSPKDGISALSGIVEADWTSATFSMNWRFTRRSLPVRFEIGEPICQFFPIRRGFLDSVDPVMVPLTSAPKTEAEYRAWARSRATFNTELEEGNSGTGRWQKHYVQGKLAGEQTTPARHHLTKLNLKSFRQG